MSVVYFPAATSYNTYLVKGKTISGTSWDTSAFDKQNTSYSVRRLKVEIENITPNSSSSSATGSTCEITVYVQIGRTNGDWDTSGTSSVYLNGTLVNTYKGGISSGCAQRNNNELDRMPDTYFTTLNGSGTKYTLTSDSNGEFSKSIRVEVRSGNTNMDWNEKTYTLSFSGGWGCTGNPSRCEIVDTGSNQYFIKGYAGSDAYNNNVDFIKVYHRTDGQATNWQSGTFQYANSVEATSDSYFETSKFSVNSASNVTADVYTIGEKGYPNGHLDIGPTLVKYHTSPKSIDSPTMSFYSDENLQDAIVDFNHNSYAKCTWRRAEPKNDHSTNNGCRFYIFVKRAGESNWESFGPQTDSDGFQYYDFYYDADMKEPGGNGSHPPVASSDNFGRNLILRTTDGNHFSTSFCLADLEIKEDDSIFISVSPWHWNRTYTGGSCYWVGTRVSNEAQTASSATTVYVRTTRGDTDKWYPGEIYIYVDTSPSSSVEPSSANWKWIKADFLWIRTTRGNTDKWYQAIK